MASGFTAAQTGRTHDRTRPMLQKRQKVLAKAAPSTHDPNVWSGRALQENFHRVGGRAVLHQCIRPLIGAFCAPGHHGYQRACDLVTGQASMGHLGHQCSHAPGRPILHLVFILAQTSAGKAFQQFALNHAA
jgi:hypothetical protein